MNILRVMCDDTTCISSERPCKIVWKPLKEKYWRWVLLLGGYKFWVSKEVKEGNFIDLVIILICI